MLRIWILWVYNYRDWFFHLNFYLCVINLILIHLGDQLGVTCDWGSDIYMYMDFSHVFQIKNGERRWYALKDKKFQGRSKGGIQLELDFIYNHVRL